VLILDDQMLAVGTPDAAILRALVYENAKLDPHDRVTIDSIRDHTSRHFPVQQVARATYREILERRASENQVDFVEGVAIALTPIAFYEVVMTKAFRTLVDDRTEVSVETGLRAAEKLQSVLDGRERGTDVLELKVQLGKISEAVRSVVPQSMWAQIIRQVDEAEHPESLADETDEGLRNHVERGLGRTAEAVQSRREAPSRSRSWPACGPRLPVRRGHRLGRWR
jgi:hypothetical protein